MKKVKITINSHGKANEIEGDGVFICACTDMGEKTMGEIFITGEIDTPYAQKLILEGIVNMIDEAVTTKQMKIIEGIEILSDLEFKFKELKDDISKKWAESAAMDPNFSMEEFMKDALESIKRIHDDAEEGGITS